ATPEEAARLALDTVHGRGWPWLTLDEVHIFPSFYEVEFNDRHDFKGLEIYVSRSSGAVGPEMGPNMMWDSQYGMGPACSSGLTEDQARALISIPGGLSVGDGEPHHGYWEFELKRGAAVVNQINVSECAGHTVVNEQAWNRTWKEPTPLRADRSGDAGCESPESGWPRRPRVERERRRSVNTARGILAVGLQRGFRQAATR